MGSCFNFAFVKLDGLVHSGNSRCIVSSLVVMWCRFMYGNLGDSYENKVSYMYAASFFSVLHARSRDAN
jgi:hypothetical protein